MTPPLPSAPLVLLGASGYLGRAVVRAMVDDGRELVVVARRDLPRLREIVAACGASTVINAAGRSQGTAEELWAANRDLVARVLTEVPQGARVVTIGSAAEYGAGEDDRLAETAPERPTSDYGRAKAAATALVRDAWAAGTDAVVCRLFNLAGPDLPVSQPLGQFVADVRALAAAATPDAAGDAATTSRQVVLHNAATTRDYVPVDVAARAVLAVATAEGRAPHPVVNVCSGVGVRFDELVAALLRRAGVTAGVVDLGRLVPVLRAVGDPTLLADTYGLRSTPTPDDLARCALPAGRIE